MYEYIIRYLIKYIIYDIKINTYDKKKKNLKLNTFFQHKNVNEVTQKSGS